MPWVAVRSDAEAALDEEKAEAGPEAPARRLRAGLNDTTVFGGKMEWV